MTTPPILFIIFNRPDPTRVIFEAIRRARPAQLFIAADGPRIGNSGDNELCQAARDIAVKIDWECEVKGLFQETNLGCKVGVSTAINWFFDQVEEGIILEDDCLPDPSFFGFCAELLERYRDQEDVMMISGDNFQFGRPRGDASYYFSRFTHIWGWATWRRAWRHYDVTLSRLPAFVQENRIARLVEDQTARDYWLYHFIKCYNGEIDTWDYQWTFAQWERAGVSILPNVNLVTNIGFGPGAVHCQNADSALANMPTFPIGTLSHPRQTAPDQEADQFTFDYIYLGKTDANGAILVPEYINQQPASTDQATSNAASLFHMAHQQLTSGQVDQAFDTLIKAKALKKPYEGLDVLRAHCFIAMGQQMAAKQALLEELRFFPGNEQAKEMLKPFEGNESQVSPHFDFDKEFQQLLATIRPYSMLGDLRLYSLFQLTKFICQNDIPGNFVECGVAAGGSSALLAYVIKTYSKRPRTLFSFDSFSGMPTPTEEDVELGRGLGAEETGWGTGTCAAPVDSLLEIAGKLGVIPIIKPVQGYYEDTLPRIHDFVGEVAFIHIDSDWYESTRTILQNFYDQLHNQAVIQFDDYGYWKGCGKALHEFEKERGLNFAINEIDGNGVWFKKAC